MTPESPSTAAAEPGTSHGPDGRSVGWQLVQVGLLLGLLLVGMYEVDLDAKEGIFERWSSAGPARDRHAP
jgi:hypothetical protein